MVIDYIRKGALCALLGLGALVSPTVIPGTTSSVYAQEEPKKEEPKKEEAKSLQDLLTEEVKRLEEKEKTPEEYLRLGELYVAQLDFLKDYKIEAKLKGLQKQVKDRLQPEFFYLRILLDHSLMPPPIDKYYNIRQEMKKLNRKFCEDIINRRIGLNPSDKLLSKVYVFYASLSNKDDERNALYMARVLDPNNLTPYVVQLSSAACTLRLHFFGTTKPLQEQLNGAIEITEQNREIFNKAIAEASKTENKLDSLSILYKLYNEYTLLLHAAIWALVDVDIGNTPSNNPDMDKNKIKDKKLLKKLHDSKRDYVFECAKTLESRLRILPIPENYANFCIQLPNTRLPRWDSFFIVEDPYLQEKSGQLKMIDHILRIQEEGLKIYPKSVMIYLSKGRALFTKAKVESPTVINYKKLSASSKKLVDEAMKTLEKTIDLAREQGDDESPGYAKLCMLEIRNRFGMR